MVPCLALKVFWQTPPLGTFSFLTIRARSSWLLPLLLRGRRAFWQKNGDASVSNLFCFINHRRLIDALSQNSAGPGPPVRGVLLNLIHCIPTGHIGDRAGHGAGVIRRHQGCHICHLGDSRHPLEHGALREIGL